MPKPIVYSAREVIDVPREVLWQFLADTDRLNRAIDLPIIHFTPFPDKAEKGRFTAETRVLGKRVAYNEYPFDWVAPRYYHVERRFPDGPLTHVQGGVRLTPAGKGTELEVFATVTPRSWLGSMVSWLTIRKKATESILALARAFQEYLADPAHRPLPAAPPPSLLHGEVLRARLAGLKDRDVAERIRGHLETASDLEVIDMRPFELADRWGEDRIRVLRGFLAASKAGAVDLSWNLLCPACRVPARKMATLAQMKSHAHCDTCEIKFGADFSASVEARFSVNPAVRTARKDTFCIGGPANTPQILAQLRVGAGEKRREELTLPPGAYRVRSYQAAGITTIDAVAEGGDTLRARCELGGLEVGPSSVRAGTVALEIANDLKREALVVVEREGRRGAATAALVTSLQDFRDFFPGEAVAPGEEIGVSSLALLFTDLKASTELYRRLGDPKAFAFVQNHFRYLVEKVAGHRGGIVKTMGDAIMAAFSSGKDAVESAVEMQRHWEAFRREHGDPAGVDLKIGIHQGPAIAINNDGKLDYFGTTVNMAARVQAQSSGGDVVITGAVGEDPEVARYLRAGGFASEDVRVELKGLDGEHVLRRLRPA